MKYIIDKNKIIIQDVTEFNIQQIFDCGQIFRYENFANESIVISLDKIALIKTFNDRVEIITNSIDYFVKFFDLETNYNIIKEELGKDEFLSPCCKFGYGIRLLKQNLLEMIVSFIVSANNNIKRIKNSLNYLAKNFGEKIEIKNEYLFKCFMTISDDSNLIQKEGKKLFYYAFPRLESLKNITIENFVYAGLGYRSSQLYKTIQILNNQNLNEFELLSNKERKDFLISLQGIGEKVANCIMLFTGYDMTSFPVDTWINKVYNSLTNTNTTDRKFIESELTLKYGELSGYAQQYFFYYYRENKLK